MMWRAGSHIVERRETPELAGQIAGEDMVTQLGTRRRVVVVN